MDLKICVRVGKSSNWISSNQAKLTVFVYFFASLDAIGARVFQQSNNVLQRVIAVTYSTYIQQ